MKTILKIFYVLFILLMVTVCAFDGYHIFSSDTAFAQGRGNSGGGNDDDDGSGAEIHVDGGWTDLYIGPGDLIAGAGTDLISTYSSTSDATLIDVQKVKRNDPWRIDIRRSDINWHENLHLYARRTGSGHGNGNAVGGLSYIEINTIDRELFHGTGLLNNITLQYQLSGVSLQVPPDSYSTTVIFTIMDN